MLRLYMDVRVNAAIMARVRRRGIEVVTAQERRRVHMLFRQDNDLLTIARTLQSQGVFFAGLSYGH